MRLITEAVNPAHAIDEPAFDVADFVPFGPLEAFLKGPIGGIEGVGMESNFHMNIFMVAGLFIWMVV
jgi:hypothetical protein